MDEEKEDRRPGNEEEDICYGEERGDKNGEREERGMMYTTVRREGVINHKHRTNTDERTCTILHEYLKSPKKNAQRPA